MIGDGVLSRLTTPLTPGRLLAAVDPRRRPGTAKICSVRPNGVRAVTIDLRPGPGWRPHRAGQHVTLGVEVDGVLHHRCYSITSAEGAGPTIEIAVAEAAGGTVSSHLVHRAAPGDVLRLGPASGELHLDRAGDGPLLFLTGGSGVTPAVGMIRTLADRGADRDVVWIHHARRRSDVMFARDLDRLPRGLTGLRVEVVLTREGGRHLDLAGLVRHCHDWRRRTAFACGPGGLVETATDLWGEAGLEDRLHVESFTPPALTAPADAVDTTATLARRGAVVAVPAGSTLLDALESAGHRPPSGCRAGLCHTCSTELVDGCARDLRDGSLVTPGAHVQLCVAGPAGALTLDL